ncbi:MAG: glutaredoxin [Firmicutes bacterium]|nr:glutaredoxin [Bacillota bacterium]
MAKKVIMYGSASCPDCVKAKEILDKEGIRYGYIDILADLARLKKFITLRDAHQEEFQTEIAKQHMGIPCFVVDDEKIYVLLPDDLDLLR